MKVTTHEVKGKTYTITVKPPNPGSGHPEDYEVNFIVEVTDKYNQLLYSGGIGSQLALYFEEALKISISEVLIQGAKAILDKRFN